MELSEILSKLQNVKKSGDGYMACCPSHSDKTPSLGVTETPEKILIKCYAGCPNEAIVASLGMKMKDLFKGIEKTNSKKLIKCYDYSYQNGELAYQVVRYEPKDFRVRRPDGSGWVWSLKGKKALPYKLPAIMHQIEIGKSIIIVEGEKDADALGEIGIVATTNHGGAGKWRDTHSRWVQGATVYIIPDNDGPGEQHLHKTAASLLKYDCNVNILRLPQEYKDIANYIATGKCADDIRALAKSAKKYELPNNMFGLSAISVSGGDDAAPVLPEYYNIIPVGLKGDMLVLFNKKNRTEWEINTASMSKEELIKISAHTSVKSLSPEEFRKLKYQLIEDCSQHILQLEKTFRQGIFRIGEEIIVISGENSHIYGKEKIIDYPLYKDHYIKYDGKQFFDPSAKPTESLQDIFNELVGLLTSIWTFKSGSYDPEYMAALMMLAPMHRLMDIRPICYITGAPNCGKTTLLFFLESLYPGLIARLDNTSSAGFYQSIGNSGCIPIIDEAADNKKSGTILQDMKTMWKGGVVTRGTKGGEARRLYLAHMAWLASADILNSDEAIRSRILLFSLLKIEYKHHPSDKYLEGLGGRIIHVMLENWGEIETAARLMMKAEYDGIDGRQIMNLSYASALWQIAQPENEKAGLPLELLEGSKNPQDSEQILADILSSIPHKENKTIEGMVLDTLDGKKDPGSNYPPEEKYGVKAIDAGADENHEAIIYLQWKQVQRQLLKSTKWEAFDLKHALFRYPGALEGEHIRRFEGANKRCIAIKYSRDHT